MKALQSLRRISPMSNMSVANRIINNITGDSVSKNKVIMSCGHCGAERSEKEFTTGCKNCGKNVYSKTGCLPAKYHHI